MPIKTTPHSSRDVGAALERPQAGKTFAIKTFGCQMNVYDSERMIEALNADGYVETTEVEAADLVVLNTCHIREKAAEKVYSDLGRLRQIKEARKAHGRDTVIAVTGCVAQAEGSEIVARQPAVDLVVGPQSYHQLPQLIVRSQQSRRSVVETEFAGDEKFNALPPRRRVSSASAFLTIQEGCDKFCTFCVVPYTRGLEVSRPASAIVAEAEKLVAAGAREITLLGQNVNAYHGDDGNGGATGLGTLLRALARIEGLARLRYTTSHPRDMDDDLIAAHADCDKLMPFLHLPVQSGSDAVLRAMNRQHTADDYRALIGRMRAARPDMLFSSDFIVGFPGETDADFEATLRLVEDIGYAQCFSFKYSPRAGTPAAASEAQVADAVKDERLARLQDLLESQQLAFNKASIGLTVPVLFERPGREEGFFAGRTPHMQMVYAPGEADVLGQVLQVTIEESRLMSLRGVISAA